MKTLVNFILYSNLWIALASVCFCLEGLLLHDSKIDFWYLCFLFCGTMIIYNGHRIIGFKLFVNDTQSKRFESLIILKPWIYALLAISVILGSISIYHIRMMLSNWILIALLISVLYITPVLRNNRLRDLPYIKVFLIALCWTLLCYLIPTENPDTYILIERFCFMMAITIPFDIRDLESDSKSGTLTIVSKLGKKWSRFIAILFAVIGFYCLVSSPIMDFTISTLVGYVFIYVLTILLISGSNENSADHYYSGYLDGLLVIRILPIILTIIL